VKVSCLPELQGYMPHCRLDSGLAEEAMKDRQHFHLFQFTLINKAITNLSGRLIAETN